MVKLSTYAKILGIIGLGMTTVTNIGIPSTMGRGYFQNTVNNERDFSILVNINKAGDYALIEKARAGLIAALNPDLVTIKQPLLLQIDQYSGTDAEIAETLQIPAHYQNGLEMDGSGDSYNERLTLNFHSYVPMFRQDGVQGTALGYQTSVANANYIIRRDASGTWAAMGTGANGSVSEFALALDGGLYLAGDFTDLGGANGDRIAKWNGTAFSALGTGAANTVSGMAVAADGTLYATGFFASMGGVANTAYIARWNGSAWSALSTGLGTTGYALAIGKTGILYVGGLFTNQGDANGDYITSWTGSAWASLGTGANGAVFCLAIGPDGTLYAGGNFTVMGGVANTAYIARWNGSAWSALGTGANASVETLVFGPDGTLYAGGNFTTIGGVSANYIAAWNGTSWSALGTGVSGTVPWVSTIVPTPSGKIYVGGNFTSAGGLTLPDRMAEWNGTSWTPMDVDLPASTTIDAMILDAAGILYVGYRDAGSATSATVTSSTASNTITYPRFVFTGPGTCYQVKNYTTGKSIYFNLTLQAGEYAILDLDPYRPTFYSSWRGNLMNTILPGSNLNFELLPGANNISAFMFGSTTAATNISMTAKTQYNGIDAAVR